MTPEQWADSALVLVERSRIVECFRRCAAEAREAVMDEFGILHGETADAFVAEMTRPRSAEEIAAKQAHLAECEEVYRSSQAKRSGERECGICCRPFANLPALLAHLTGRDECAARLAQP